MSPVVIEKGRASPLVLSIPHAGVIIPHSERHAFLPDDESLARFIDEAVDWYTDELYDVVEELGGTSLRHTINRIVVDTERFEDDELESMAVRGLGVIYTKTYSGAPLRHPPSAIQREELLSLYFRPYHNALTELVTEAVESFGYCLLLDCHSFGSIHGESPFYNSSALPDLCIGTHSHHEDRELTMLVRREGERAGMKVSLNDPYSGVVVPTQWYGDDRVVAYMLELNKALYLEKGSTQKNPAFEKVKTKGRELIAFMLEELRSRR